MEATAGGELQINAPRSTTPAGPSRSPTPTSTVELVNVDVQGGTLNNAAGGVLETIGNSALDGFTQGALKISTGSFVTATDTSRPLGTINNLGMLEQIGGDGQNGFLDIGDSVTLTGGGTVLLDTIATNGANAYIQGNNQTLTNMNNTIVGTGYIGNGTLVLINGGVIDAAQESSSSTLTLNGGGITNTNLMEASAGATLSILTNVNNTGGAPSPRRHPAGLDQQQCHDNRRNFERRRRRRHGIHGQRTPARRHYRGRQPVHLRRWCFHGPSGHDRTTSGTLFEQIGGNSRTETR